MGSGVGLNGCEKLYCHNINLKVRGGADKSLARPTSLCRRKESIMSLERRAVHVPNCSLFLLQRIKGSMSGGARDFNNIETRAVIKFFFSVKVWSL